MNIRVKLLASIICFSFMNFSTFAATTINTASCSCSPVTGLPTGDYYPNKSRDNVNPVNFSSGLGFNGGLQKCDCSNQSSLLSRSTIIRHTKCKTDKYKLADFTVKLYGINVVTQLCVAGSTKGDDICAANQYFVVTFMSTSSDGSTAYSGHCTDCPDGGVSYIGDNADAARCFKPADSDSTGTYEWVDGGASGGSCYYTN